MRKISITVVGRNEYIIKCTQTTESQQDGILISFFFQGVAYQKQKELIINEFSNEHSWIYVQNGKYFVDLLKLKNTYNELFRECSWMNGKIDVYPEYDEGIENGVEVVSFIATSEEIKKRSPKKIFLSHKGANKDTVREYYRLLKELGFDPWIDEEDMGAGVNPHRAILQGFKESCGVVFFITPQFKDEGYLETEIDYAIHQRNSKGSSFSIVTLLLEDEKGTVGKVPELLENFIWKTPKSQLEAFKEIIRALPIKVGIPVWK